MKKTGMQSSRSSQPLPVVVLASLLSAIAYLTVAVNAMRFCVTGGACRFVRKLVSILTMGSGRMMAGDSVAAQKVCLLSHGINMGRVDAFAIATQMVTLQPVRYFPYKQFIHNPVGITRPDIRHADSSIAATVQRSRPFPTRHVVKYSIATDSNFTEKPGIQDAVYG